MNSTLPTEELKKYGIINEDLSFSTKLNTGDIQKFLQGYTIVADHDKSRATFQLTDNNTKLKVIFLERDKSISDILANSKKEIEYTDLQKLSSKEQTGSVPLEKKAFIFDRETNKTVEFDFIKNATELTAIIADKKEAQELNRYKNELLKLKSYLLEKADQYPEISKNIQKDINIVTRELQSVNHIFLNQNQNSKESNSDIQLNVNERGLYEDANNKLEMDFEEESEEKEKSRGFRR